MPRDFQRPLLKDYSIVTGTTYLYGLGVLVKFSHISLLLNFFYFDTYAGPSELYIAELINASSLGVAQFMTVLKDIVDIL